MISYTQEGSKTIIVCIDSYEHGVPSGRFYNPHLKSEVRFYSLIEFIRRMDKTLTYIENLDPPQSADCQAPNPACTAGSKATFAIRILFRQNGSWQGLVTWLDKRREYSFRSALELVMVLGDALELKEVG